MIKKIDLFVRNKCIVYIYMAAAGAGGVGYPPGGEPSRDQLIRNQITRYDALLPRITILYANPNCNPTTFVCNHESFAQLRQCFDEFIRIRGLINAILNEIHRLINDDDELLARYQANITIIVTAFRTIDNILPVFQQKLVECGRTLQRAVTPPADGRIRARRDGSRAPGGEGEGIPKIKVKVLKYL